MKFCWCTITADNIDESIKFYQEIVGLPVSRRFKAGPSVEIAFLGDGETKVELICEPSHKAPGKIEGISLGFEIESVDEMMKTVKEKGYDIDSGPYQPMPNIKFFYMLDPNGLKIQLIENIV